MFNISHSSIREMSPRSALSIFRSVYRKIIKQVSVSDEEAFHYTSPDGLVGILNSEKLYFTRYDFLNDMTEGEGLIHIYKELVDEFVKEEKFSDGFRRILLEVTPDFKRRVFYELPPWTDEEGKLYNAMTMDFTECTPYVCSFSSDPDSIPMWSYYVKGEKYEGYNIGVCIREFFSKYKFEGCVIDFQKVVYYEDKKKELLSKSINEIFEIYREEKVEEVDIKRFIIEILSRLQLVFKNKMFIHEKEIRVIIWVPNKPKDEGRKFEIKYRTQGPLIIPYIEYEYNKEYIRSIMVGPVRDKENAKAGIKALIYSKDLEIDVDLSTAPLRY